MGYLNLKNLTIRGNPTLLIKNNVSKNTVALLAYLRDRLPGGASELEWEVAEINNRLSGRQEKKRKEEVPDYEFNDPFKNRVDSYNRNEYNKYVKGPKYNDATREKFKDINERNDFGIGERERHGGYENKRNFGHGRHRYGEESHQVI